MKWLAMIVLLGVIVVGALVLGGYSPELGGERWCERMESKSVVDWTPREAKDFATHCIRLDLGDDRWCKRMQKKSVADWTPREAKDYATRCVFD